MEEERVENNVESSSIFDKLPVTLGDNEEADKVTDGGSQVSRAMDQTAAGKEEEDCLEE